MLVPKRESKWFGFMAREPFMTAIIGSFYFLKGESLTMQCGPERPQTIFVLRIWNLGKKVKSVIKRNEFKPYILKARIAGFIIPQKNLNFPKISSKMPQNGPKIAKNGPK